MFLMLDIATVFDKYFLKMAVVRRLLQAALSKSLT